MLMQLWGETKLLGLAKPGLGSLSFPCLVHLLPLTRVYRNNFLIAQTASTWSDIYRRYKGNYEGFCQGSDVQFHMAVKYSSGKY